MFKIIHKFGNYFICDDKYETTIAMCTQKEQAQKIVSALQNQGAVANEPPTAAATPLNFDAEHYGCSESGAI